MKNYGSNRRYGARLWSIIHHKEATEFIASLMQARSDVKLQYTNVKTSEHLTTKSRSTITYLSTTKDTVLQIVPAA